MPLYDWKCIKCDHEFEELASSSIHLIQCPECGAEADRKVSAAGGYSIKGNNSASVSPRSRVSKHRPRHK